MKKILHILLLLPFIIGCAATPTGVDEIHISSNDDSELPIDAHLIIDMLQEDRNKTLTVQSVFSSFTLNEGDLIESAALKVFGKVFNDVDISATTSIGHLVARVGGDGNVSAFSGTYTVNASLDLADANDNRIGRYQALGENWSAKVNEPVALENAYIYAFEDIAQQILSDPSFIALQNSGFGKKTYVSTLQVLSQQNCQSPEDIEAINRGAIEQLAHIKDKEAVLFLMLDPIFSSPEFEYEGYRDLNFIASMKRGREELMYAGVDEVIIWKLEQAGGMGGAAVPFSKGCVYDGYGEPDYLDKLMAMHETFLLIKRHGIDDASVRAAIKNIVMVSRYGTNFNESMVEAVIANLNTAKARIGKSDPTTEGAGE